MRLKNLVLLTCCVLPAASRLAAAEPVALTGVGTGSITWRAPAGADSTVEWASALGPTTTWHRNWLPLVHRPSTNGTGIAAVPMYYRVSSWTNGLFVRLPVGRCYTYAASNQLGQTWTETIRVTGMASIVGAPDNHELIEVRQIYTGAPPEGVSDDDFWLGRATPAALYGLDDPGREQLVWTNAPVGTAWTNGTVAVAVLASETVVVPAGSFSGCLKVRNTDTSEPPPHNAWEEWVKPGFFMVRWVDYFPGPGVAPVVYSLTSWSDP